jgi:hypothetical protein
MLTIGTWNCRMGAGRKTSAFQRLGCDVLVVPECNETPALATTPGTSFAWKGRYPRKGIGVFGFGGWRFESVDERDALPWVLPLRMIDPRGEDAGLLLATWTVANSGDGWPSYAAQVTATIDAWEPELRSERVVLAGDLNCSAEGPSANPHLANIQRLEALGVRSAYHAARGVPHGSEPEMTLRWIGPGRVQHTYHCDFVFLSSPALERLRAVEVGTMAEWVESGLSDHAPVVARLE